MWHCTTKTTLGESDRVRQTPWFYVYSSPLLWNCFLQVRLLAQHMTRLLHLQVVSLSVLRVLATGFGKWLLRSVFHLTIAFTLISVMFYASAISTIGASLAKLISFAIREVRHVQECPTQTEQNCQQPQGSTLGCFSHHTGSNVTDFRAPGASLHRLQVIFTCNPSNTALQKKTTSHSNTSLVNQTSTTDLGVCGPS